MMFTDEDEAVREFGRMIEDAYKRVGGKGREEERSLAAFTLVLEFAAAFAVSRVWSWSMRRTLAKLGYEISPIDARRIATLLSAASWWVGFGAEGGREYRRTSMGRAKEATRTLLKTSTGTMKKTVPERPE